MALQCHRQARSRTKFEVFAHAAPPRSPLADCSCCHTYTAVDQEPSDPDPTHRNLIRICPFSRSTVTCGQRRGKPQTHNHSRTHAEHGRVAYATVCRHMRGGSEKAPDQKLANSLLKIRQCTSSFKTKKLLARCQSEHNSTMYQCHNRVPTPEQNLHARPEPRACRNCRGASGCRHWP